MTRSLDNLRSHPEAQRTIPISIKATRNLGLIVSAFASSLAPYRSSWDLDIEKRNLKWRGGRDSKPAAFRVTGGRYNQLTTTPQR